MLIKNTNDRPVKVEMNTRTLDLNPGDEVFVTAEEVRDGALRECLQVRTISIVRPATVAEEAALRKELEEQNAAES